MGLSGEEWTAIMLTLRVAAIATLLSLPFAIAVAYVLARCDFFGKALVDALIHLPLVLPPVVTGYALLLLFGRKGVIGSFLESIGIVLAFRWTGAALAAAVMAFPLMVRAIRIAFETSDLRLEQAAATLGASPMWRFATITLPLAFAGLVAGAVLAFAKALGEFGATITFVSNIPGETQTIATAIYTLIDVPGGEARALRLAGVSLVISLAALLVSDRLSRRAKAPRPT